MLSRPSSRRRQRGLSIVEMMVGIAIGLFIVAGATVLVASQLTDNRRLLTETRLQQDLRAAADIMAREVRRAGFWSRAETGVWNPSVGPVDRNTFLTVGTTGGPQGAVSYDYRRLDGTTGPFGFKVEGGVIKTHLSGVSGWQDLTDKNVMYVDSMVVTLDSSALTRLACPKACPLPPPAGQPPEYCWPTIEVRSFVIRITAHALSDAAVQRSVESRVRLRNDAVTFHSGPDPLSPQACPA